MKARYGLAILYALSTVSLYAEGVLKNGLIELVLLAPAVWFVFAPEAGTFLRNPLVLLATACLAISASDLLLRPVLDRRLNYTSLNMYSHKLPALPIVGRWDPHLKLVDMLYGDLAAMTGDESLREPREIMFETDEAGFRNTSSAPPIELVVLGDSFGAGWGTTQGRIFASLLETDYGHRTYNLSFPGGPYDQYINLAIERPRLALAAGATVVWTFYTGNDLEDTGGETWDIAALPWRSGLDARRVRYRTFRNRSPLNRLMEAWRERLKRQYDGVIRRTLPTGQPILFREAQEVWGAAHRDQVEQHPNFPKILRTMQAMKGLTDAQRLNLVVVILPTKGEVYRWILDQREPNPHDAISSGFAQAVLAACDRVQLRCLDTKPYLAREAVRLFESSGELLWWRDDTHLGERGHEAVARFIAQQVLPSSSHAGMAEGDAEGSVIGSARYTGEVSADGGRER